MKDFITIPRKVVYLIPENSEELMSSENDKITTTEDKTDTEAEKKSLLFISKRVYEIIQQYKYISGISVNL